MKCEIGSASPSTRISSRLIRSLPQLAQPHARADPLRIDRKLEHARLPGRERTLERGLEVLRPLDPLRMRAVRACERREVGVLEIGADDAPRELSLLVHADRRVHAVVDEQDDDRQLVLHRGRELGRAHDEVAVAGEADDDAVGMDELRGDGGRQPVAHRAATAGTPASRTA